jgi:hypothetical protein
VRSGGGVIAAYWGTWILGILGSADPVCARDFFIGAAAGVSGALVAAAVYLLLSRTGG